MTRIAILALSAGILVAGFVTAQAADTTLKVAQTATNAAPTWGDDTRPASQRYTDALNYLEANGYTGITAFKADGQDFDATAWHDGKQVSVIVNPDAYLIKQRS